jgi:hypothetical protein
MVSIRTAFDLKSLEKSSWKRFLKGHVKWYSQYLAPSK